MGGQAPSGDKEGKTPALGDDQAKRLLDAPDDESLQGVRDRAILAVLLYQGLRREELSLLQIGDLQERRGVKHLRIHGKAARAATCPCTRLRLSGSTCTWRTTVIERKRRVPFSARCAERPQGMGLPARGCMRSGEVGHCADPRRWTGRPWPKGHGGDQRAGA